MMPEFSRSSSGGGTKRGPPSCDCTGGGRPMSVSKPCMISSAIGGGGGRGGGGGIAWIVSSCPRGEGSSCAASSIGGAGRSSAYGSVMRLSAPGGGGSSGASIRGASMGVVGRREPGSVGGCGREGGEPSTTVRRGRGGPSLTIAVGGKGGGFAHVVGGRASVAANDGGGPMPSELSSLRCDPLSSARPCRMRTTIASVELAVEHSSSSKRASTGRNSAPP